MRRRTLMLGLPMLASSLRPGSAAPTVRPVGAAGEFATVADWTFGKRRGNAAIRDMDGLSRAFYFRYIYDHGNLAALPFCWSVHRNYPDGDPRSLHVFTDDSLILKARIPPDGGLRPGGIETGMLRAKLPFVPGMYVEMRAKLPHGLGVWPAFWLNPGVEHSDGTFSELPWPPEIDIFEFFVWQGRSRPTNMSSNVQTGGKPQLYGNPHDIMTRFTGGEYSPGIDFSSSWNVFALDWRQDEPIWMLNGEAIKQTAYKWPAPPAHILVDNQVGIAMPGTSMAGITDGGDAWDYAIDYLRVFQRI